MILRMRTALSLSIPLCAAMFSSACSPITEGLAVDEGSETATETGDGDGDDEANPDTGDGDGEAETGDGDGEPSCPIGSQGCPCTMGGGCDPGLVCEVGVCSPGNGGDEGDGDGDEGDGDGDEGDGDGDGDPNQACAGDHFLEIEAEAADEIVGWVEQMSTLGEDVVLGWDNQTQNAYVTWNIDVPCQDEWHIWVRAINAGQNDSFFATVDGAPNPAAIFEVACDNGPQQPIYMWRELNWRGPNAPGCQYLEDPWTQDWTGGVHTLTLRYRESYAISKLWITNTNQTPP